MPRRLAHFSDPRLDAQIGEIIKKHKELQKDIEQLERRLKKPIELPDAMPPTEHEHDVADITDFPDAMTPTAHKDTHAGGSDPLTPADIGAAPADYESSVEGFTPATVAAALDALAGVRIVEMGENENGRYARWENGLMVCWWQKSALHSHPNAMGPIYRSDAINWTYPASFVSIPVVVAGATNFTWASVRIIRLSSSDLISFSPDGSVRETFISAVAIGRWK